MNNETMENKILRLQQEYLEKLKKVSSIGELEDLKVTATREIKNLKSKLTELTRTYEKNQIQRDEFTEESQKISIYTNLELFKIDKVDNLIRIYESIKEDEEQLAKLYKQVPKDFQDKSKQEESIKKISREIEEYKKILPVKVVDSMVKGPEQLSATTKEKDYETAETKENHSNGYNGLKKETIDLMAEIKEIEFQLANAASEEEKKRLNDRINVIANEINDAYFLMTTPLGQELREIESGKEPEKLSKNNLSVESEIEMQEKNRKLSDAERTRKKLEEKKDELKGKLKQEINEEKNKKNNNDDFDTEKESSIIAESLPKIVEVDNEIRKIEEELKKIDKKIKKYKKEKETIQNQSLESYALGISYLEYKNIVKQLEKNNNKILNEIFEKKNLGDVLHKRGRTKDERKRLHEARNEIFREIIEHHKKVKQIKSIEEVLTMIFDIKITDIQRKKKPRILTIPKENLIELQYNLDILDNGEVYTNIGLRNTLFNKEESTTIKEQPETKPVEVTKPIEVKEEVKVEEPIEVKKEIKVPIEILDTTEQKVPVAPINIESEPVEKIAQIKEILEKIIKDYKLDKKNAERYHRENLKVSDSFRREMHSGNFLYNVVHTINSDITMNLETLKILSNQIINGENVEKLMYDMKSNIDSLTEEETEKIWNKYKEDSLESENLPQIVQMVIQEKMNEYAMGKIESLTIESTRAYKNIFIGRTIINELNRKIIKTVEEKEYINKKKEPILIEILKNIDLIKTNRIKAKENLSVIINKKQDDKVNVKMNDLGYNIAIENDVDPKFEDLLRNYEVSENQGRIEGNYQKAVFAFIEEELLLEENTKMIMKSLKKTGKKQYTPIEEAINYVSNPFVRDMITSLAYTDEIVTLLDVNDARNAALRDFENNKLSKQKSSSNIYSKVQRISDNSDTYFKGLKVQAIDDETKNSIQDTNETVLQKLINIATDVSNNKLSKNEALRKTNELRQHTRTTLQEVINKCYDSLAGYRKIKPQFNLDSAEKSMQKLLNNAGEANEFNQLMINANFIEIESLGINEETLSALPSELYTTLIMCISSAALAGRIDKITKERYNKN